MNDYKEDKPRIKQLKALGILTNRTPLKNHERIALWHVAGGPRKHPDATSIIGGYEVQYLLPPPSLAHACN